MITTFVIEIACAMYVIARYKLTPVSRLAVAVLIGLAVFQLAEFNVCEGSWGVDSLTWARIGYVAITLLPPLGLHLMTRMAGVKQPLLVVGAYAVAAVFACIFLFVGHGMRGQECLGNYVIFEIAPWAVWPYALYYYGLLLLTVGITLRESMRVKARNVKAALISLAVGYAAFIVPTTFVNVVDPTTIAGIPSIMCGFAVILALILTGIVIPKYHAKK
ncbi:histidine kinase N-terminal 7TM domain-containing protein [Streptomyces caniscabiei]|uniref:histidine kinase N-terminal 7TM domain-containing protein n=1 Tax=Streptomyces caniscabiei TaxID=2746961 RepID=UPI0029B7F8F9|nr:histidine kinase N-terminal 7TM domain-containing protein [Streptomyces caniscabiei]MDX2775766.1 histidine kinase N-terminal 7TM domain-containing protein [Streptomyces caniscabiei]